MSRLRMWLAGGVALAAITTAAPTAAFAAPAAEPPTSPTPGGSSAAGALAATEPPAAPPGHVQPLWRRPEGSTNGVTPNTIGEPGGYDPDELRAYLHLNGTGQGQTVALVEAWDVSTSVTRALEVYDSWYGLKPACSDTVTSGCFQLTVTAPNGTRTPGIDNGGSELFRAGGWQEEAGLDAEILHAIAPDAAITVVEAFDDADTSVTTALDYAASLHASVISNSWGDPESAGEQARDGQCPAAGAPCVFSSGDAGNPGEYPAASPDVLAVGGTTLDAGPTGQVRSETAWAGSGGGISPFEPRPAYQAAADPFPGGRGIPDVSFDADPDSGIDAFLVTDLPFLGHAEGWAELGGTSAGAPAWSAILAVADQQRALKGKPPLTTDQVHNAVYGRSAKGLADITTGANGICGAVCSASPGYDLVTGQGSPRPGIDIYLARH